VAHHPNRQRLHRRTGQPQHHDQTLTYDDLGELTQISGGTTGTTSYLYGADGGLLLQQDPSSTVLYLAGEQITLSGTSTTTSA
jgi:hypothetical protein